jgi:eukaryotic-like serine/threonine-protein kinase
LSALPREVAGRYTVRSPIGEGAYSVTYRAIDNALQRDVAIKVLREQYAAHEGFDSRFEREARSAARISHPNVISVYDYGRQGHLPYIIMQFVDGPNLKEYVREEGPLTVEESINFARQILDGLSAIHDEGIIHRDVKPQNVLIDDGMQAKITDFGVAFVTVDPGLTETGMAVGTAAYMAPEQASGEAVGPQADLYAVGVILYELLTGRLPFPGDNPVQVMYRHVNEMPAPPRSINRSVPLGVEAVVLKALAKDALDRFPDARTMRDALVHPGSSIARTVTTPVVEQPVRSDTGEAPRVVVSQPRRRQPPRRVAPAPRPSNWPVVLLLLLVAGLVVVLLLLLQSGRFQGFA